MKAVSKTGDSSIKKILWSTCVTETKTSVRFQFHSLQKLRLLHQLPSWPPSGTCNSLQGVSQTRKTALLRYIHKAKGKIQIKAVFPKKEEPLKEKSQAGKLSELNLLAQSFREQAYCQMFHLSSCLRPLWARKPSKVHWNTLLQEAWF